MHGEGCSLQASEEGGTWTGGLALAATCPSRPRPSELPGEFPGGRFWLNSQTASDLSHWELGGPQGSPDDGVQGLPTDRDCGGWYEVCSVQGSTAVGAFGGGGKRTAGRAPWGGGGQGVRGTGEGRRPGGHPAGTAGASRTSELWFKENQFTTERSEWRPWPWQSLVQNKADLSSTRSGCVAATGSACPDSAPRPCPWCRSPGGAARTCPRTSRSPAFCPWRGGTASSCRSPSCHSWGCAPRGGSAR